MKKYQDKDFEMLESQKCDNCKGPLQIEKKYTFNKATCKYWCFNCYDAHMKIVEGTYWRITTKQENHDEYCEVEKCYEEQEFIVEMIFANTWVIKKRACSQHAYSNELFGEMKN